MIPFTELPCTFRNLHAGATRPLWEAPWSVDHDHGVLLYCPASFAQAHIQLHHHVIGIELNPGIVRVQFNSGPMVDNVLKSCSTYFLPAGSVIEVRKEQPIEFMLLTIDPRLTTHVLPEGEALPMVHNIVDAALAAKSMELRSQLLRKEKPSALANELVVAALSRIAPHLVQEREGPESPRLSSHRVRKALNFIGANFSEKITVNDVADAVGGISPHHFAHTFAATLGQSPHQYILEHRLRHARDLLTGSSADIADIAYGAGFSDQAHMTEAFRKRVGVTPAQMRRLGAIAA
jgi:AraC family transcriptional regulator